jgi:hypothetical protein
MGVQNDFINAVVNRKRVNGRAGVVDEMLFEFKCDRLDREFALPFRKEKAKKHCIRP